MMMKKKQLSTVMIARNAVSTTLLLLAALSGHEALAQQKINDGTVPSTAINANAIADYQTNNKGVLLPRIALTATTAAAPLSAHVAGMTVYNTATAGTTPTNVTPGWYYNDGDKWVRLATNETTTNLFGSGAPTGSCSSNTLYTDTSVGGPTSGQQYACSGGTWVAHVPPPATEWYSLATTNDAGSNKFATLYRNGSAFLNYTPGAASALFGFSRNSSTASWALGGFMRMNENQDLVFQNASATGRVVGVVGNSFSINTGNTTALPNDAALNIVTAGGEALRISSGGPSPYVGRIIAAGGGNKMVFDGIGSTQFAFNVGGGERLFIGFNGNIGIGTGAPTALLSVNGAANNATGAWGVFSDARVKTVDAEFTDGLNVINKIRTVKFHYNANAPFKADGQQIGVVAQELEKIAPYMVSTSDYKGEEGKAPISDLREVNNQAYIFLLINAVKEQQQQIEALKAEVRQLKK